MEQIKDDEIKKQLAKECLDNKYFQLVFTMFLQTLENNIDGLSPANKEQFTIFQAQKYLLRDVYNTFVSTASDEVEEENPGLL